MPTSLYAALDQRGLRPDWAEDSIVADLAGPDEATSLEIEAGAPVLRHSRRALAGDIAIEVSRSIYRGDRFTLWVQLGDLH
jgi:GntR family transcriptional regulator